MKAHQSITAISAHRKLEALGQIEENERRLPVIKGLCQIWGYVFTQKQKAQGRAGI